VPPPPAHDRARATELRAELARVHALERAGNFADALAAVRPLLEPAAALDWPPLWAAAKLREAALLERNGDYVDAERAASEAYFEASRIGAWDIADMAASRLVFVVGGRLGRFDDGVDWSRHGEVACAHAGDPTGMREARRLHGLADVYSTAAKYEEARELHERALVLREAALGPEHPSIGTELTFLADTYVATGDYAEATPLYERALAIEEHAL
jgi:tetratricopeptide (TPR) repeat protein